VNSLYMDECGNTYAASAHDQRIPRYFDPGETILETCFNCGEEGHVAVNCPMEKRKKPCFVCGLFGHNAKQCTQVGLSSSEELSLGDLGMSSHALDELTVYDMLFQWLLPCL
jgi:hypothetical protein